MLILFFICFFRVGIPYYIIFVILFLCGSHEPNGYNSGCKVMYKFPEFLVDGKGGLQRERFENIICRQ